MRERSLHTARQILNVLSRVERLLSIAAFTALVVIIFSDVLSRQFTGAGLYWATQSGVWANVLIVMAGFGLASSDGAHLRPRFADGWLPQRWHGVLESAQHGLMSLFCAAACALAASVVAESFRLGEVSLDLFVPIWPVQALLPFALGAATLRHAIFAFAIELRPAEAGASVLSGKGLS